jgi:excisionase family DNA binding protein
MSPLKSFPVVATIAEFAALTQLHPNTVYEMVSKGTLPGVRRFGRSVRIVVAEALGLPSGVASLAEASGLLKE